VPEALLKDIRRPVFESRSSELTTHEMSDCFLVSPTLVRKATPCFRGIGSILASKNGQKQARRPVLGNENFMRLKPLPA